MQFLNHVLDFFIIDKAEFWCSVIRKCSSNAIQRDFMLGLACLTPLYTRPPKKNFTVPWMKTDSLHFVSLKHISRHAFFALHTTLLTTLHFYTSILPFTGLERVEIVST